MFCVSEAQAAVIRTAFEQRGKLSAVAELRRLFPGVAMRRFLPPSRVAAAETKASHEVMELVRKDIRAEPSRRSTPGGRPALASGEGGDRGKDQASTSRPPKQAGEYVRAQKRDK